MPNASSVGLLLRGQSVWLMLSKEAGWCERMLRQLMASVASLLTGHQSHGGMTSLDPIPSSRNDEHLDLSPFLHIQETQPPRQGYHTTQTGPAQLSKHRQASWALGGAHMRP